MKKIFALLIIAVLAMGLLPTASFAAEVVRYEAEDAEISVGEIRNAGGDYASSVSGGKFVGGFDGVSEAITFTIKNAAAGSYRMTIGYISMEMRSFEISVNGNLMSNCRFDKTGKSWDGDTLTFTVDLTLRAGTNIISLGSSGFSPSLDYIELEHITCEHKSTKVVGAAEATLETPGYTGDIVCNDCGMTVTAGEKTYKIPENRYEAEAAEVTAGEIRVSYGDYVDSVSSGKFVGGFDGMTDAVIFTVNVDKAGTYEMEIGYISRDPRSYDITVNGEKTEDVSMSATGNDWWGDTQTETIEIQLNAGENTITFGQNDNNPVPNLDYIQLSLISESAPATDEPATDAPSTDAPVTGEAPSTEEKPTTNETPATGETSDNTDSTTDNQDEIPTVEADKDSDASDDEPAEESDYTVWIIAGAAAVLVIVVIVVVVAKKKK